MTVDQWDFDRAVHKIAIIGNGGGGKSRLARQLGEALDVPVFSVDDHQWLPGWQPRRQEEFSAVHDSWLSEPGWIIDGWGGWEPIDRRFAEADLIVFVDLPLTLHYRWVLKRQVLAMLGFSKDWPPAGCSALSITWPLMRTLWRVHRNSRPRLLRLTSQDPLRSRVVDLHSPSDLRQLQMRLTAVG